MRIFCVVLGLALLVCSSVNSARLYCEYSFCSWPVIGNVYTCRVKNLNVTQPVDNILRVSGSHLTRKSNVHVRALDINGQNCNFLPQRIRNFFPNVELLRVHNSRLKTITQDDLKPMSKLRVIHFGANQLTTLENDLFASNPDLVRIEFKNQILKLVGYNILDGMRALSIADFQSCGCLNYFANSSRKGIEELKKEIRINCQPISEFYDQIKLLNEKITALEATNANSAQKLKLIEYDNDPNFVKLDSKLAIMESDHRKCVENSEAVSKNFINLMEKFHAMEDAVNAAGMPEPKIPQCALMDISNRYCKIERERLTRAKRELYSVDVACEKSEWDRSPEAGFSACNVAKLKITHSDFEIRNITMGHLKQIVNPMKVDELKIFNQQINFLPMGLSEKLPSLKVLNIIKCGLLHINTTTINGMKNLQSLIFAQNDITSISKNGFANLDALKTLDLSINFIHKIDDETFHDLPELTTLKLNNNFIGNLTSTVFSKLPKLTFLFLNDNRISTIGQEIFDSLKKIEFVDLSKNECIDVTASRTSKITIKGLKTYFRENCFD